MQKVNSCRGNEVLQTCGWKVFLQMLYILPGNVHDFCLKARIDVNSCHNGDRLTEVAIGHWEKTLVIQKTFIKPY